MLFSSTRLVELIQGGTAQNSGLTEEPASSPGRRAKIARSFAQLILACSLAGAANAQFVQQGGLLLGAGATGNAGQGYSVALSSDGNTALVGGPNDDNNTGAAWVFMRSGGVWTQQGGKLVGSGAIGNAWQGFSVALSADGNTAIVGGPCDNGGCDPANISFGAGTVWVFTRSGGVWTQQGGKLVGSGAVGNAGLGTAVALSADGNTAIASGPVDNGLMGATWVFTRSGGVWAQQGDKLVGTGATGSAVQGYSVGLSGDGNTVIAGGPSNNRGQSVSNGVGGAWVFTRLAGVWTQQGGILVGSGSVGNAAMGNSVALSGDGNTAIVGGENDNHGAGGGVGAAWVFTRSGGVWTQQGNKLVGADANGQNPPNQGWWVALSADGNTAIAGGPDDNFNDQANAGVGAAWVFTRSRGVWIQQGGKLVGTGAVGYPLQGWAVALSGDSSTAIVGGPCNNGGCAIFSDGVGAAGAACVFAAPQPPISSAGVLNAASSQSGGMAAPGEMVFIYGSGIGPATGTSWQFVNGVAETTLAQTEVLFNGTPAPLIYVSATQINAIVPYEVAGQNTVYMQVSYQGNPTNTVTLNVAATAPAVFTVDGSGAHGGAILNQDSTLNTAANPAAAGTTVQIFATGEGVTNPPSVDGMVNNQPYPSPTFPVPAASVSVTIGGQPAAVKFAGTAPGGVAGFLQVNAVIPAGLPAGPEPIVLKIGDASSPAGVTLAVQ